MTSIETSLLIFISVFAWIGLFVFCEIIFFGLWYLITSLYESIQDKKDQKKAAKKDGGADL